MGPMVWGRSERVPDQVIWMRDHWIRVRIRRSAVFLWANTKRPTRSRSNNGNFCRFDPTVAGVQDDRQ